MIHILLMILKITGIILLSVLGTALALILAVLFVPVRYKAELAWHGEPDVAVRASWLLRFLSVRVLYTKDGLKFVVRVLGVSLLKKRDKDAPLDAAKDASKGAGEILGREEQDLQDELKEDEARFRKSAEERKTVGGGGMGGDGADSAGVKSVAGASGAGVDGSSTSKERLSPLGRIKSKVKALREKLQLSFTRNLEKLKGARAFVPDRKAWLEDERSQASFRLLLRQLKRLAAHVWPKKGKGSVTFGFDDPYTTGQALCAVSLVYPFIHKQISVTPVFDGKVLDAEVGFAGRVRLAYPLWLAIQVFMDRHTRRMIRGFIK